MKWQALKYALPFTLMLGAWRSFHANGWMVWIPLGIAFLLIPLLEVFIRPDGRNPDAAQEEMMRKDPVYDVLLYLVVPFQYLVLFWFLQDMRHDMPTVDRIGKLLVMGLYCGVFGINVAHELGHRVNKAEQWMAKALLLTSLYEQFYIEHNKGHHKNVATPGDPSSARMGEPLYLFWVRSISGVYTGAWHIANDEMKKQGLPAFHWKNEMLQLQLLEVLFCAAIAYFFGLPVMGYFIIAAIVGSLLLETVNYIEHYGLSRRPTTEGRYERTMPHHSWNSDHVVGRLLLFELSRHSDHHYMASRKYQILRHHDDAPQLPTGYPGSMLLATIPPLWFRVMNGKVRQVAETGNTL